MAIKRKSIVSMKSHVSFYDKIFEPERKRLQNKLGVNFTQSQFTEYLAKSNARITYPKIRSLPIKRQFAPRRRKGRFTV